MACLPLANVLHYKVRSALSALGIGVAVCMLITLSGLSRGSLSEVADRWEAVDAELVVFPRGWGDHATAKSGAGLSDRYAERIRSVHGDKVRRVVPVFTWPMMLAGQDQIAAGVDAGDWPVLTGGRRLSAGRLFDPEGAFSRWIESRLLSPAVDDEVIDLTERDLSDKSHNGLELVVDSRLARAGGWRVGDCVLTANHRWSIVGIVPAGGLARVYLPRRTAQFLFGSGDIGRSTLLFVKLADGVDAGRAARNIRRTTRQDVVAVAEYRGMLAAKFGIMLHYVDAVNAVALGIAFLFILVTLHTMVSQRTREIAILKSCGASDGFVVGQVLGESLLLTGAGAAAGMAMSFAAAWAIEAFRPLLTVRITWQWIVTAGAASAAGALLSGAYPAWRATKVDMAAALTFE